jgi:hypothetical protein
MFKRIKEFFSFKIRAKNQKKKNFFKTQNLLKIQLY